MTEFKHIPDCITASTITPFITESFKYEDNTELSTVFDWLYNCIKSKPNMSVEAAISLMDAFNRGIRIALRTGIDEEPDFSKTNIYSVGKYYKYFVDKVEDAFVVNKMPVLFTKLIDSILMIPPRKINILSS